MKKFFMIVSLLFIGACATNTTQTASQFTKSSRKPSSVGNLSGDYLGEGHFPNRSNSRSDLKRPAMRLYLEATPGEINTYYGVICEYSWLEGMARPYLTTQLVDAHKLPDFNKIAGYLNNIVSHISAYKFIPGADDADGNKTYEMHNLEVHDNQIVVAPRPTRMLKLKSKNPDKPLVGALILGNTEGIINFPSEDNAGFFSKLEDLKNSTQFELASFTYRVGKLKSTWRGSDEWNDSTPEAKDGLVGSWYSEYGNNDGVLELYSDDSQKKSMFTKTKVTKAKNFTNPKSATIQGDYLVNELIPKMYVLTSANGGNTASDVEMGGRIMMFLDVFDGSSPEAGGHRVTELAYTNPNDPKDFMMYYEDLHHAHNVGVLPHKH